MLKDLRSGFGWFLVGGSLAVSLVVQPLLGQGRARMVGGGPTVIVVPQ